MNNFNHFNASFWVILMLYLIGPANAEGFSIKLLSGSDAYGHESNRPADWPENAGKWNAKAAQYEPTTQKLLFESLRRDIVAGGIPPIPSDRFPGISSVYVAGPLTGALQQGGTTVIYVSEGSGQTPRCLGCTDIVDGVEGIRIFSVTPSTTNQSNIPIRQPGMVIYANQNKDMGRWLPGGQWLVMSIEMPRHALAHELGNGEIGMFNNLWAVSIDGKTWVQLTAYEKTWTCFDSQLAFPFPASDRTHCPSAAWYASKEHQHPYSIYLASEAGEPPPSMGVMRPVIGNHNHHQKTPIIWAERVGLSDKYVWGGALQLALADISFQDGLPTLTEYKRNITPTPQHPDGIGLWSNPDGNTVIGAGYEPFDFSRNDRKILFASDVFLSTAPEELKPWPGNRKIQPWTQAFTDVIEWTPGEIPQIRNVTAFDQRRYNYEDNGDHETLKHLGHWEEPAVYYSAATGPESIYFGSSANLIPAWNPVQLKTTIGLDVWLMPKEKKSPSRRLTHFNRAFKERYLAYPTSTDPRNHRVFVTVIPNGKETNAPGSIYVLEQ